MPVAVFLTLLAGGVAGGLGALLGIGGGVFLVPALSLGLGLTMHEAAGISLVTVIATSSVTPAPAGRFEAANLRLGMVLEIFATAGGLAGILIFNQTADAALQRLFAVVLALAAIVVVTRVNRRNVITDPGVAVGRLGGRFVDADLRSDAAYRVTRPIAAFGASFAAGVVSMLGIGAGVFTVPVLNTWCGVPARVAAATSALLIGATALIGAINYYMRGEVIPHLAAAAVLGVLAGSRLGFAIGARHRLRSLELLMAAVLIAVAILYVLRAGL